MLARRSPGAITREHRLHHVGHRADRTPVGLAEHAQRDKTERHRQGRSRATECHTGVPKKSDWTAMRTWTRRAPRSRPSAAAGRRSSLGDGERPERRPRARATCSSSADMPPATSSPTGGHMTSSSTSTRRASAASSPCDTSHGGSITHAEDAADQHAGADAQADDDARADVEQRHAEAEADARREVVDDERNGVADPAAAAWPGT